MEEGKAEPNVVRVEPGELTMNFVGNQQQEEPMRETKFVNRMPANDTDTTIAYGVDDQVLHQVDRTSEQDANGYPEQMSIEVGEPDPEPEEASQPNPQDGVQAQDAVQDGQE